MAALATIANWSSVLAFSAIGTRGQIDIDGNAEHHHVDDERGHPGSRTETSRL
jgi:hypothetical protein